MDEITQELLNYIDESPTPPHATDNARNMLQTAGFTPLAENEPWNLQAGGSYFTVRNYSSIIAFRLPAGEPSSFRIIGAHTDSPNLRLKPQAERSRLGYRSLHVEAYGGVLLNSWTDRDLSIAGQVFYRDGNDALCRSLVNLKRPLCRISQPAIHLNRDVNKKGLILNEEKHLSPILGLTDEKDGEKIPEERLRKLLARILEIKEESLLSFDLQLYPFEKAAVAGLDEEFILAPRLDNQAMCHAGLLALAAAERPPEGVITLVSLFDNEEIGSETAQGAGSPFLGETMERIFLSLGLSRENYLRSLSSSWFVSADMAHALHPNYPELHDDNHKPRMNGGPVLKINGNKRYATEGETAAFFEMLAERAKVPLQKYAHRADLACGSTIGPITAANLGIRVADVGAAMLSMHSAREMAGSEDPPRMTRVFTEFFR